MAATDPIDRSMIARQAALSRWAKEDPSANAARGQAGLLRKFYDQTDPDLPEAERHRRAECARRAHMVKLARKARRRNS
jgi:hypothetical protein